MTAEKQSQDDSEADIILNDLQKSLTRVKGARGLELKHELSTEVYPHLLAVFEHLHERLTRVEDVQDDLIDEAGNMIQEDLSQQILGTLDIGRQLAVLVLEIKAGVVLDDIAVKKLHEAANAFVAANDMTVEAVVESTLPENPDADGDEGEGDGEGGEEEEEE